LRTPLVENSPHEQHWPDSTRLWQAWFHPDAEIVQRLRLQTNRNGLYALRGTPPWRGA
jgi:hypothetical protein